jgi:hypothetical protein
LRAFALAPKTEKTVDNQDVTSVLAGLVARVETLHKENARLSRQNSACADTMRALTTRVENLQAANAELTAKIATKPKVATAYRKRPAVMRGRTVQSNVGCGPLYITLNEDESGKPFEVFFKLGKSGSCQQSYLEALGVAMSVGLRYGADPQKFVDKFEGMRCPNPKMRNTTSPTTLSCADGISQGLANALALALPGTEPQVAREAGVISVVEPQTIRDLTGRPGSHQNGRAVAGHSGDNDTYIDVRKAMQTGVGLCPKCSGPLISQGGCTVCLTQCGYVGPCN